MDFFKKLKESRESSGYIQQEMADMLEITIQQYQKYEGNLLPPHNKLIKINEILNVDLSVWIYKQKGGKAQVDDSVSLSDLSKDVEANLVLLRTGTSW